MSGDQFGPRYLADVIPTDTLREGSGRHLVIACPVDSCRSIAVDLYAVQAVTDYAPEGTETTDRRFTITMGNPKEAQNGTPVSGRDPENNGRSRAALCFVCAECGHSWAAVFARRTGRTIAYRARATVTP